MATDIASSGQRLGWLSRRFYRAVGYVLLIAVAFALFISHFSAPLQPIVYSIAYVAIAAIFLRTLWFGRTVDVFSPTIIAFILLYLYSMASALGAAGSGKTLFGDLIPEEAFDKYYIACLLGLVGLGIGFLVAERKSTWPRLPSILRNNLHDTRFYRRIGFYVPIVALILCWSLRTAFDFTNAESYYQTAQLSRVLRMEKGEGQGLSDYFLYLGPLTLVLVAAVLWLFRGRNIFIRLLGLALIGAHLATAFLSGWRGSIVYLGCIALVFFHYRIRRFTVPMLVILTVGGVVLINLISLLRSTSDPQQMVETALSLNETERSQAIDVTRSGELLTGQNLMRLIKGLDNGETNYTLGASFFTEGLVLVPREFYPNRPLPMAEKYVDTFYPGVLESGGGYGFFYIMEGYWAFGFFGVLVSMAVYGWVINAFYRWCMVNMQGDAMAFFYGICLYPMAMFAVRSGMIISVKTTLMDVLPLLLIMAMPDIITNLRRSGARR